MPLAIFQNELDMDVPCSTYQHNRRFLDVIGVAELQHFFYKKVGEHPMGQLANAINTEVVTDRKVRDAIWVFVFTNGEGCSDLAVPTRSVHAVSVFCRANDGLAHRYFERVGAALHEVEELAVTVKAVPDLDDIRLLHFAAFELGQLPAHSAIYEFKGEYWGVESILHISDSTLRTSLLLDAGRLAGAPTMGLYGHEVYTALLGRQQGGETANCGNSTSCSTGTASCEPVPPKFSAGYACKSGVSADAWVGVLTAVVQAGLVASEDVDFEAGRALLTELLPSSPRGRQLMALFYVASSNGAVRYDRRALEEYARALPTIQESLRELLTGPDDAVVISNDVRAAWDRIASLHQDVRLPAQERLARAMGQLEWSRLTTKRELLSLLNDTQWIEI